MDKTKKYVILFIVLSFLCIFVYSFLFSKPENESGKDIPIVDKGDQYEHTEDEEKNQSSAEIQGEEKENQGNKEQEQADQSGVSDHSNSNVDHAGSQEKEIVIHVSIKGLDGILLASENIMIEKGSSAFMVLEEICEKHEMNIKTSGFGKFVYVQAIGDLKEKEHGAKSGWKYSINGTYISKSAGSYVVEDNDIMEWYYEHD